MCPNPGFPCTQTVFGTAVCPRSLELETPARHDDNSSPAHYVCGERTGRG